MQKNFPKGEFYQNIITGKIHKVIAIGDKSAITKTEILSSRNLRPYKVRHHGKLI